jgi:chorismate mutase/prephenate dehydratase
MELQDLRTRLDDIDRQLLSLFLERMNVAREVARLKLQDDSPIFRPGREREILLRAVENAGEMGSYARILFATLLDLSRTYQARLTGRHKSGLSNKIRAARADTPQVFPDHGVVACQGVDGAYSQIACDRLFTTAKILYFKTFEGVFNAVEQGLCEFGVLPIENSTAGSVSAVYDLMKNYDFHIARSIKLQINHSLLAKPGVKLEDIREVYSHEQAIGQCPAFLKEHPQIKVTMCENTAVAAGMVANSERTDVASLSSPACAGIYGLQTLADNVQNSGNNYTRFICITKAMRICPGANKISLMLTTPHTPGALYAVISKFSALGVNLTKLESRPIPGSDFDFLFYFDMEASVYSEDIAALLDELASGPELFVFLGNYMEV